MIVKVVVVVVEGGDDTCVRGVSGSSTRTLAHIFLLWSSDRVLMLNSMGLQ